MTGVWTVGTQDASFRPMRLRKGGLPRIPEKEIPPGPQPAQEAEP